MRSRARITYPAWMLMAAFLALPSAASAYRTLEDDPAIGSPARWADAEIAWDLHAPDLDATARARLQQAVERAFMEWTAPGCARLEVRYLGERDLAPDGSDHIVTFHAVTVDWGARGGEAGRGATTDLTLGRTGDGDWEITDADVVFDFEHFEWLGVTDAAGADALDPQVVALHEIGHVLGIAHNCELVSSAHAPSCDATSPQPVMFPSYDATRGELAADDVAAVCALYPDGASACEGGCGPGEECDAGVCVARCEGEDCVCASATCGSCADDGDCVAGECAQWGDAVGMCLAPGSAYTACARGADCESRLCLSGTSHGDICTRECGDDRECPAGGRCVAVESRRVCAPPRPASGCAVAGEGSAGVWGLGLLGVLAMLRRRRS